MLFGEKMLREFNRPLHVWDSAVAVSLVRVLALGLSRGYIRSANSTICDSFFKLVPSLVLITDLTGLKVLKSSSVLWTFTMFQNSKISEIIFFLYLLHLLVLGESLVQLLFFHWRFEDTWKLFIAQQVLDKLLLQLVLTVLLFCCILACIIVPNQTDHFATFVSPSISYLNSLFFPYKFKIG